jgi:hypothetical protein
MEALPRRGDGFTQKDFALRNASWLISDIMTDRHADKGRREGFQAPISNDTPVADEKALYQRRIGRNKKDFLIFWLRFMRNYPFR